jgi:hypothetical protein
MMANRLIRVALLFVLVTFVAGGNALGQVLFTDTFDTAGSAANFNVTSVGVGTSGDPVTPTASDVYSEFGFDYSATGGSRLTQSILTATTGTPSGGGSTSGLLLAANLSSGNRSAINVFPIIAGMGLPVDPGSGLPVIDGDYKMTFDFFAGVNGTGDLQSGGVATTEFLQVGAQSKGDGTHINGFQAAEPDSDYMELNANGDLGSSDGILFTTRNGSPTLDAAFIPHQSVVLQDAFPRPHHLGPDTFTSISGGVGTGGPDGVPDGGAPAERWSVAEVRHVDGVTTFSFNGVDVGTISFSDFGNDLPGNDGLPWFGYTDFFSSVAGNDSPLVDDAGGGPLDGDHNGDGSVDAADYVVWRKIDGTPGGYDDFRSNFGQMGGGGGASFDPLNASYVIIDNVVVERITLVGSGGASVSSIPEPSSAILSLVALAAACCGRRR